MSGVPLFYRAFTFIEPPTASSVRALLKKLQGKKLTEVPGMDVNAFNISIQDCVRRISGCCKKRGHIPPDLALIVAQCYRDTQIQEFDLEVINIINRLTRISTVMLPFRFSPCLAVSTIA
jgi:hypothetical protein